MIRRLIAVWPPPWAMILAGVVYLVFQAMFLFQEWIARGQFFRMNDGHEVLLFLTSGFAAAHAVYRVAGFHPAFRAGYFHWLRGTPWTSQRPLPLGPVHLVWQDFILLAALYGLAYVRSGLMAFVVIEVFLAIYILMLGAAHSWTGQKFWGYATLFACGFLVMFYRDVIHFAIAAAVAYATAFIGLRLALDAFPWEEAKGLQKTFHALGTMSKQEQLAAKLLGWPYDRLGPPSEDEIEHSWDAKYIQGILLGWWFFVGYNYLFNNFGDGGYVILYGYMISSMIGRVCAYCNGYAPPINIWGRLTTGRLIIPGYDQVVLAPFAVLAVGIAAWYVPLWLEFNPIFATPIALAMMWWIIWGMPPSLRQWRLTGNHRIVPAVMANVQTQ